MSPKRRFPNQAQNGFSLVIVLVFLAVLLMIGVAGMQASSLEERMAAAARDTATALEAGEATLLAGQTALVAAGTATQGNCALSTFIVCETNGPNLATYNWTGTPSIAVARNNPANNLNPDLAQDPRYLIEAAGSIKVAGESTNRFLYRITARATGRNAQTIVTLQSYGYVGTQAAP